MDDRTEVRIPFLVFLSVSELPVWLWLDGVIIGEPGA